MLNEKNQECHMKQMTFLLFLTMILSHSLLAKTPPEEQEEGEEEEVARIV